MPDTRRTRSDLVRPRDAEVVWQHEPILRRDRLRPILLTTTTTVVGLLPLWFGGSPMFVPMAIAIIFGLLFATILTLGVVPVLYSLLFRVSYKDFRYRM